MKASAGSPRLLASTEGEVRATSTNGNGTF